MNIDIIIISILYIITLGFIIYMTDKKILPYLNKKNELKEKEIKNKKYELFKTIDTEAMNKIIDDYFDQYINRYIAYKFLSKKQMYIKSEEMENMIKDLTKLIYIQISELYIFYISMNQSISNDDDLLEYIHTKVQNMCIESTMNYNSSMISS